MEISRGIQLPTDLFISNFIIDTDCDAMVTKLTNASHNRSYYLGHLINSVKEEFIRDKSVRIQYVSRKFTLAYMLAKYACKLEDFFIAD